MLPIHLTNVDCTPFAPATRQAITWEDLDVGDLFYGSVSFVNKEKDEDNSTSPVTYIKRSVGIYLKQSTNLIIRLGEATTLTGWEDKVSVTFKDHKTISYAMWKKLGADQSELFLLPKLTYKGCAKESVGMERLAVGNFFIRTAKTVLVVKDSLCVKVSKSNYFDLTEKKLRAVRMWMKVHETELVCFSLVQRKNQPEAVQAVAQPKVEALPQVVGVDDDDTEEEDPTPTWFKNLDIYLTYNPIDLQDQRFTRFTDLYVGQYFIRPRLGIHLTHGPDLWIKIDDTHAVKLVHANNGRVLHDTQYEILYGEKCVALEVTPFILPHEEPSFKDINSTDCRWYTSDVKGIDIGNHFTFADENTLNVRLSKKKYWCLTTGNIKKFKHNKDKVVFGLKTRNIQFYIDPIQVME